MKPLNYQYTFLRRCCKVLGSIYTPKFDDMKTNNSGVVEEDSFLARLITFQQLLIFIWFSFFSCFREYDITFCTLFVQIRKHSLLNIFKSSCFLVALRTFQQSQVFIFLFLDISTFIVSFYLIYCCYLFHSQKKMTRLYFFVLSLYK